jgi:hypothetical protein
MNTQMGDVDVLLIEAKQYSGSGVRIVAPTMYGFTERIREIKRAAATEKSTTLAATDWESFKQNAEEKGLEEQTISAMRKVYDACKALQADISWGRGKVTGSFSPVWPSIHQSIAPFSVYANAKLETHLSSFQSTAVAREFSAALAAKLLAGGLQLPPGYQDTWLYTQPNQWVPKVDVLVNALKDALPQPESLSNSV